MCIMNKKPLVKTRGYNQNQLLMKQSLIPQTNYKIVTCLGAILISSFLGMNNLSIPSSYFP